MNSPGDEPAKSPSERSAALQRLIIFTRFPVPGQTKTRLIPALGAQGAAQIQRRLTLRTLKVAETLCAQHLVELEIQFAGATESSMAHWVGDRFKRCAQAQGDLGQRMLSAFNKSFTDGTLATVLIGSDCPQLTPKILADAFERLKQTSVVIGPAADGGYYLIGLRQPIPELFSGPGWGSANVLADSLRILDQVGVKPALLQPLDDIDRPEDVARWEQIIKVEEADLASISVIIPALNESQRISSTVSTAMRDQPREVIVVDGGSRDETALKARQAGATVVTSQSGRAKQLNAGASRASGNVLLFVHADTLLPERYRAQVAQALASPTVAAGAFRFALEDPFLGRNLVVWITNLRSTWGQMPYGDQGLFLRRAVFEELGGFADLPILEDYEFVRRLRKCGRIVTLPCPAVTSARRWRELGVVRTTLINKWMILGYRLGWPVQKLAAFYRNQSVRRSSPVALGLI